MFSKKLKIFGLALLLNYFPVAVNAQELSFDLDNFKEVKAHIVSDSTSQPNIDWKEYDISFAYEGRPVSIIIKEIMVLTKNSKAIVGLEQLDSRRPGKVAMMKVKALKAVTTLLKCEGFRMREYSENYKIEHDASINRNACLY